MRTTDFMRMSHAQAAMKASDIAYENEQLRQQLAEKDAEIKHLDRTKAEWKNTAKLLGEKLAASQLQNTQLREYIASAYKMATESPDNQPFDWAVFCEMLHSALALPGVTLEDLKD